MSKSSSERKNKKMDTDLPITGMWSELQKDNRLPKGVLTSTCELELQELMKQIDKLVWEKKKDWERQREALQSRLGIREKECQMQKTTLEQKHKEIGQLKQQYDSSEKKQRDLVTQYESQLSKLQAELQKLQREYERLQKRYTKQKKETESVKERSVLEIHDRVQEVERLSRKCEDYRQRSKDWEIERRGQQKQIENLEAQRKALSDKCEFVQQQAQSYQAQLDRRREILDSTELSLNAQIGQLEAKLNCCTESLHTQNSKVEKLKASLDEAMKSHKKAMDDNEKLLNDLKKTNTQLRKTEELNAELTAELKVRDNFLQMSEEDSKQRGHDIELLEKQVAEKDKIIRSLSGTRTMGENEDISRLQAQLNELQEEARLIRKKEEVLTAENNQLQDELNVKRDDCDYTNQKLDHARADVSRLEGELTSIKSQLEKAQTQLTSMTGSHQAEVQAMKDKLAKVTTDLHDNNNSMAGLTERATEMERKLRSETEESEKKDQELKLANAQIDALRLENRHLRQTIIQQTQINLEHTETETQLREIHETYQQSLKSLEQENESLRDEMSRLQHEVSQIEEKFDLELQRTLHEAELSYTEELRKEDRHIKELEEDSDRRVSMLQDRLDSTINRYEEQLQLLRKQKARVEDELDRERDMNTSYVQHGQVVYEDDDEVMYVNDNMSLTHIDSADELASYEVPVVGDVASEKFLQEEQERAKQLESIIDNHIEQLMSKADAVINKRLPDTPHSPTVS